LILFVSYHCRPEDLPSPIDMPPDSGRARDPEPLAYAEFTTRQPVISAGSQTSRSSMLRKVAMNEVRRAFFTSTSSSSSLADDSETIRPTQTSEIPAFADYPISDRLLLILWLDCRGCIFVRLGSSTQLGM